MGRSITLKYQVLGGIGWVSLSQFLRYLFQFAFIAILARLLSVDDFGIMAIVMAFTALSLSIGDLGLSAAIVQNKNLKQNALSSALWVCALAGSALFVIMIKVAPVISHFFHKEIINSVITVFSLKFIIDSFGIVADSLLRKELLFRKVAVIEICETLSFGLISIGLAFNGWRVWSLVYGYIFSSLLRVCLLWIIYPWRPNLSLSLNSLNELIRFAKNMFSYKVTNYLISNIDRIIIGRSLGSLTLGYYSMAYNISNFAREKISGIVNKVAFPAFSKIQEDKEQLMRAYLKIIKYASIIIFPLLCGLILLCPEFVRFAFSEKWNAMVVPLQYLCIAGMISSITTFVGLIFLASGHAEIEFHLSIISLFALISTIVITSRLGITAVAIGICVYSLLINIIAYIFVRRLVRIDLISYVNALLPAIIYSAVMLIVLKLFLLLVKINFSLPDVFLLISSAILGMSIYLAGLYISNVQIFREIIDIFCNKYEQNI
ncbi:MAG: MOP flippase family protein [Candidatus Omnitrophota bacterium]